MHDIICPNCGERFLGYDVAFDMSDFILPLLYKNVEDADSVKDVKFKYYVDEDAIRSSNKSADVNLLFCNSPGGPGFNDTVFSFVINGKTVFDYVLSKYGSNNKDDLLRIMEELSPIIEKEMFNKVTALQLSQISMLYHVLFGVSEKLVAELSIEDEHVRTALKVLNHIYKNRGVTAKAQSLFYDVCIYSSNLLNDVKHHVPDILFVRRNGVYERLKKCCRFCGTKLPQEFGYYKMKPVVMLGSHASGKTSYLLALLHAVQAKMPFIVSDDAKLTVKTLSDDLNLEAFMKNIGRFRNAQPPAKTDFLNVPILNLLIQNTIYSFIDWPGEKFISGEGADVDYIYKSKKVITSARHVFFFLPPEQIDLTLPSPEENVRFDIMSLNQSLSWHLSFPDRRKFSSLTFIANKIDKLKGKNNTDMLFGIIDGKDDYNVYNNGWIESEFANINNNVKEYLLRQNPQLYHILNSIKIGGNQVESAFLPVAPYGKDVAEAKQEAGAAQMVIHEGFLAGLPFLRVLRKDGLI